MSSLSDILNTIADEKALALLNLIATKKGYDSEQIVKFLELSRKEFYSRISRFIKVGLVKRQKGRYSITLFGRIVHEVEATIGEATSSHWKLRALDALEDSPALPEHEVKKVIDSLVDNELVRKIFLQTYTTQANPPQRDR
jgi:predicted transcriptional regulator